MGYLEDYDSYSHIMIVIHTLTPILQFETFNLCQILIYKNDWSKVSAACNCTVLYPTVRNVIFRSRIPEETVVLKLKLFRFDELMNFR